MISTMASASGLTDKNEEKLEVFLRERGLSEETIDFFKKENIDVAVLQVADDQTLQKWIPRYGDRLALRDFCKKHLAPKKLSLIEKLREKVMAKNGQNSQSSSAAKIPRKVTRKIEIGWMCLNVHSNQLCQVRQSQGGGTRQIDINKEATGHNILEKGKKFFFPNGVSIKGPLDKFEVELLDFKSNKVQLDISVETFFAETGLSRLRFYLSTVTRNEPKESSNSINFPGLEDSPDFLNLPSTSRSSNAVPLLNFPQFKYNSPDYLNSSSSSSTSSTNALPFNVNVPQKAEIVSSLALNHNIIISERQLRRKLQQFNLCRRKNYTDIVSVAEFLNHNLRNHSQLHGYKWMHLKCLQHNFTVTQENVRLLLQILDPEGVKMRSRGRLRRRQYKNKGPNYLWHMDCYDKLKPFGICISGCIDGFSRHIIWLKAGNNTNNPRIIAKYYLESVKTIGGCPLTIRADKGTENGIVENMQCTLRAESDVTIQSNRPSFMYGTSPANQRIESWWAILRKHHSQFWLNTFNSLKDDGLFSGSNLDKSLIQLCFMKIIQDIVDEDSYLGYDPRSSTPPELIYELNEDLYSFKSFTEKLILHRGNVFQEIIRAIMIHNIDFQNVSIEIILPNGKPEVAEDLGGVFRDVLSEFWTTFYEKCTEGTDYKIPFIRHDFGEAEWKAIGNILCNGFVKEKYFPIKLAPTFMLQCLNKSFTNDDVVEDFLKYVNETDRELITTALHNFEDAEYEEVVALCSTYKSKWMPSKNNFRKLVEGLAEQEIIQKGAFVSRCFSQELERISEQIDITKIYSDLKPTIKNVISAIKVTDSLTENNSKIYNFLIRFLKESDEKIRCSFLRFCTGSDLVLNKIKLDFIESSGLSRVPIGHTCSYLLQIPNTYENYVEFRTEFNSVLMSCIWVMDIV